MDTDFPWPRWLRGLASLLIVAYLLAVILPPLAGPPPASMLANVLIQPFRPLIGGLSLGHGYRFFAPDPGPGHSIQWTATLRDGSTRTGTIPDPAADWPRLLYHRRFMLPEKLAGLVPLPDAPAEIRDEATREWQPLVRDIAGHLLRREGAAQVVLVLVEHYLPTPEEVVEGRAGDDILTPLGTYAAAEAAP
jgi:hypothetical protein